LDAIEIVVGEFDRGQLSISNESGQPGGGEVRKISVRQEASVLPVSDSD